MCYEKETIFLEQHVFIYPTLSVLRCPLWAPNTTSTFQGSVEMDSCVGPWAHKLKDLLFIHTQ